MNGWNSCRAVFAEGDRDVGRGVPRPAAVGAGPDINGSSLIERDWMRQPEALTRTR